MDRIRNKSFHRYLTELKWHDKKADIVFRFTNGRTHSSSEMNDLEAIEAIQWLGSEALKLAIHKDEQRMEEISKKPIKREVTPREKRYRAKIIAMLCSIGYVKGDNTPDYDRINGFIQQIGSRNPRKVILNYLYEKELKDIIQQVESYVKNSVKHD